MPDRPILPSRNLRRSGRVTSADTAVTGPSFRRRSVPSADGQFLMDPDRVEEFTVTTPPRIRVAVIFGGRSPEHGVSAVSAGSIIGALDQGEFEVVPVGITRDGQWVLTDGHGLALDGRTMPEITSGSG